MRFALARAAARARGDRPRGLEPLPPPEAGENRLPLRRGEGELRRLRGDAFAMISRARGDIPSYSSTSPAPSSKRLGEDIIFANFSGER